MGQGAETAGGEEFGVQPALVGYSWRVDAGYSYSEVEAGSRQLSPDLVEQSGSRYCWLAAAVYETGSWPETLPG